MKEIEIIIERLLNNDPTLTSIELGYKNVGDYMVTLSEALKSHQHFTSLCLSGNKITDQGLISLSNVLKDKPNLVSLRLYANHFTAEGAKVLLAALENNQVIAMLSIGDNRIIDSAQDISYINDFIEKHPSLTYLNLQECEIKADHCMDLADVLKENKNLATLYLHMNGINDQGAKALGLALYANLALTELDLSSNCIGEEGAKILLSALTTNYMLTTLNVKDQLDLSNDIGDDPLNEEIYQTINQLLQRNKAIASELNPRTKANAIGRVNHIYQAPSLLQLSIFAIKEHKSMEDIAALELQLPQELFCKLVS